MTPTKTTKVTEAMEEDGAEDITPPAPGDAEVASGDEEMTPPEGGGGDTETPAAKAAAKK